MGHSYNGTFLLWDILIMGHLAMGHLIMGHSYNGTFL